MQINLHPALTADGQLFNLSGYCWHHCDSCTWHIDLVSRQFTVMQTVFVPSCDSAPDIRIINTFHIIRYKIMGNLKLHFKMNIKCEARCFIGLFYCKVIKVLNRTKIKHKTLFHIFKNIMK